MRKSFYVGLLAASLAASPVFAAETKPADGKDQSKDLSKDQLQAQLDAAQEKLEAAAKEVAELSGKISGPVLNHFFVSGFAPPRSVIGVQLDPESGKNGARVVEVSPGGAAAEAGIRTGDVIVALDGQKIEDERSARQVTRLMRDIKPRSKVKVRVLREGKPKDFEVTAREGMRDFALASGRTAPFPTDAPDVVGAVRLPAIPLPPPGLDVGPTMRTFVMGFDDGIEGMELATLTPTLGKYFGTEKGVLVVRAPERTAFKLEDGDVILSIGGRQPTSVSHATRILRSYQPGEKVDIKLMRQRKPLDLQVTVPDRPRDEYRREAGLRFNTELPTWEAQTGDAAAR
jgi:C-terminal processing protease CtpA/Prc